MSVFVPSNKAFSSLRSAESLSYTSNKQLFNFVRVPHRTKTHKSTISLYPTKLISAFPERQLQLAQEDMKIKTTYDLIYKIGLQYLMYLEGYMSPM